MHSKQGNRSIAYCSLEYSARFNTTGDILYSNKPPESPWFPASAPCEMNHSESIRCTMNYFSVPDVFCKTSCGHDAGNAAEDSKVGNLDSDLSSG